MNAETLQSALSDIPLGGLRFFSRIGSTNDEAARWAASGAPDLALVIADEQTAGKGRQGRKWFTPPGAALAFSLVLHSNRLRSIFPEQDASFFGSWVMRLTALGSLAVCLALQEKYQLAAQIKWPNDVLLKHRKTAGILVEAHWFGDQFAAAILGIGINVAPESVPPEEHVTYPATCVESALGHPVDRLELLRSVLAQLLHWRDRMATADFLQAWDEHLAFKGEWVEILEGEPAAPVHRRGVLIGLDGRGGLILKDRSGQEFTLQTGELRLRPEPG